MSHGGAFGFQRRCANPGGSIHSQQTHESQGELAVPGRKLFVVSRAGEPGIQE